MYKSITNMIFASFLLATILLSTPRLSSSSQLRQENSDKKEGKVEVRFYGEAQCPYCRKFVTEAWQPVWTDPELKAAVDYDFIPWGNAYFATEQCGKGPSYDSTQRMCWGKKCHGPVYDDDCFMGRAIYQHSDKEGAVDIYETCAKMTLGLDAAVALTYCAEGPKMDVEKMDAKALVKTCLPDAMKAMKKEASEKRKNEEDVLQDLQACFEMHGKQIEISNAIKTPEHTGVPWVVVEGKALENPFDVKDAICKAIVAKKLQTVPKACKSDDEERPSWWWKLLLASRKVVNVLFKF